MTNSENAILNKDNAEDELPKRNNSEANKSE